MARPPRPLIAGGFYHVWCNENTGRTLFPSGISFHMYGRFLLQALERYEAECHAWCLMTTHYHLLLRTRRANLDRVMQFVNGRMAAWTNYERGERGHLFRGRYGSTLIEDDAHFLTVARYIELNPVAAGIVADPAAYRWSSHRGFVDPLRRAPFHTTELVLAFFGSDLRRARRDYRAFVLAGINRTGPATTVESASLMGSDPIGAR